MSSRHQKEKRLRPRHDPYKRDQFDQSKYLRIPTNKSDFMLSEETEEIQDEHEFEDFE